LRAFGRYNDVLAYPTYQASYAIPVRQYRVLPVGFLHCIPHGKPACHLLMLPDVTPAHKGLTPSGNISCYTLPFNHKNLYFQHFFRAFSSVCTCSCWAHTRGHKTLGAKWLFDPRYSHQSTLYLDSEEAPKPQRFIPQSVVANVEKRKIPAIILLLKVNYYLPLDVV